jgi:chorismate dehydratase
VTKLRISIVQYLNTAPLVWGFTHGPLAGKYDLSFTVPSQCAEALRAGAADIAIIPAIEYQRINGLAILPDVAIASKTQVRSLLLVAKKPVTEVRSIALDSSSRSTQALTRILCADHWRIAPQFSEAAPELQAMLQNADAHRRYRVAPGDYRGSRGAPRCGPGVALPAHRRRSCRGWS